MTAYWVIFLFIAVGMTLQRIPHVPSNASQWLNQSAIFVCLPALILIHVPTLEPNQALLPLMIIPWALLIVTALLVLPITRALGWSREVRAVLLVLLPLGNTSFLGFPLVEALLGSQYLSLAVVYDQFGSFLMVSTHVLLVVAWYSTGSRVSLTQMAKRLFQFPPFLALLVALLFGHEWLGAVGLSIVEVLAAALLPIVTLAIGLALRLRLPQEFVGPLVFGIVAKLLILPMVAGGLLLGLGWVLDVTPAVARVALLEAAMPSMITASALLCQARLAPALSTAMVAWTVLLSVATVPLWYSVGLWIWGVLP